MSDVPEMVERVARALWEASPQVAEAAKRDDRIYADFKRLFVAAARVAIAAMREPTEAMVRALLREKFLDDTQHNRDVATLDWQEMIAEALTGSPCRSASEARPPTSEP